MGILTSGYRVWFRGLLVAGVLSLPFSSRAQGQTEAASLEYQVKAAYLLNFTRYVEWPGRTLPPDTPLEICVLGDDPFGSALDQAIRGRRTQGREIAIRRIQSEQNAQACHLVFLTDESWGRRRDAVGSLTRRGILTVGDSDQFVRSGGVIGFVISNETVRFSINLSAMERSGLKISSRMLSLALQLHETEGTPF
jgi:hypothetical protein